MHWCAPGWHAMLHASSTSASGPRLPTLALQQVASYLGNTGRAANVIAMAALDPKPTFDQVSSCKHQTPTVDGYQRAEIGVAYCREPARMRHRMSRLSAPAAQVSGSPALRSPSTRCSRSFGSLKGLVHFQLSIVKPGLIRSTSAASLMAS